MDDKPTQVSLPLFDSEEWRDIPGFEGRYQVSNHGRVKSLLGKGRVLKPGTTTNGHQIIGMTPEGQKARYFYIHRIVATVFIGAIPDGMFINHIDGNPKNNDPRNLEFITHSRNIEHGYRLHGKKINGRKAKLVVDLINQTNKSLTEIAEIVGVTRMNIYFILQGRIWREYAAQITDEARALKRPNYIKGRDKL